MNRRKTNLSITIIYFIVALAYCFAKAVYSEIPMYFLISTLVITASVYYMVNTTKSNLIFFIGLGLVFIADIFHVMTSHHSLVYGTTFFFLFNSALLLLIAKYLLKVSYKKGLMFYSPILISFLIFQYMSYSQDELSQYSILIFYLQLVLILILAFNYYNRKAHKSSFLMLVGVTFMFICYAFGAINKLIIQNPYYSFVDSLAFAAGIHFVTQAVCIEDYYEKKEYVSQLKSFA